MENTFWIISWNETELQPCGERFWMAGILEE